MKIIKKITITEKTLLKNYPQDIFSNLSYANNSSTNHKEIAKKLINKNPYTITIIIENLNIDFWRKKEYAQPIKIPILPKYAELLLKYFFEEYGECEGNQIYGKYLEKYRGLWDKENRTKELDDYIIEFELEPHYKEKVMKKYKNIHELNKPRFRIERERYYNLPSPLNHIDWRNPYDNIFVWQEDNKKLIKRGGSGSSGQREINSLFTFGFGLINQSIPIPSYLFLYSDKNELFFIKKFSSLCLPYYDIGSNYFLSPNKEQKALQEMDFINWKDFSKVKKIVWFKN